jgi:hypothetical protein
MAGEMSEAEILRHFTVYDPPPPGFDPLRGLTTFCESTATRIGPILIKSRAFTSFGARLSRAPSR